jgi:hypothetical protein
MPITHLLRNATNSATMGHSFDARAATRLSRPFGTAAPTLPRSASTGRIFEDVYLGNNLRSFLSQFAVPEQPQRAPERPLRRPRAPFTSSPFSSYETTSATTYGSFSRLPALPNQTGALRQPLFLASGVGASRAA